MARKQSTMEWRGLKDLQAELRAMPAECQGEALKIIEGHVNAAYVTIKRVYEAHVLTGTLSKRLTISTAKLGLVLRSGSPLAWLFDNGSKVRHYITVNGKKHVLGKMRAYHIFSRTVGFAKRRVRQDLKDMLLRRGAAAVTGE